MKEGGRGPGEYEGSWTWFETAIVRNFREDIFDQGSIDIGDRIADALDTRGEDADSPVTTVRNPHSDSWTDTWHVQSNVRARGKAVQHTIVWTEKVEDDIDEEVLYAETGSKSGRGFVRSLEMRDRIAVIARAKVGFRPSSSLVRLHQILTTILSIQVGKTTSRRSIWKSITLYDHRLSSGA